MPPGLTTDFYVCVCVYVCLCAVCVCACVNVSLSPQTTDDIVSSAECSSDDEDLEECDSGHAGGMGVLSCACLEPGLFSPYLSLICYRGASPLSIMSHESFKCNLKKKKSSEKVTSMRKIHLCEGFSVCI